MKSVEGKDRLPSGRIFSHFGVIALALGFVGAIIVSNVVVRFICEKVVAFYCPRYWPVSIVVPRLPDWRNCVVAAIVVLVFMLAIRLLFRRGLKIFHIIIFGVVLVIGSNLVQGWEGGFTIPVAGGVSKGIQLYHDAIKIRDPVLFLRQFEQVQQDLLVHSRVNPPGAVLLFYLLSKLVGNPAYIAVVIAVVSASLSMFFLYGILSTEFAEDGLAGYVTFLFILIPGVQIYYAATLDALVASFLLGVLYFFMLRRHSVSIIGSVVSLFLASFLKFLFVFILPVIVALDILKRKSIRRSGLILLSIVLVYTLIYAVFGFNYVNSFVTASVIDNPEGFRLFADPASYVFTRLAGVFEIIVFFGPFLSVAAVRGIRAEGKPRSTLTLATWTAAGTLCAMFLVGVFRYGETGRVCLFFYPYMVIPIASYLKHTRVSSSDKKLLLCLVFAQTTLMQMFGNYFW